MLSWGPPRGNRSLIAVLGEALIDLVGDGTTFHATPGGSPANVAVGLARLGMPVAMVARLSADRFGGRLRQHLTSNDVDLRFVAEAQEPTTLAIASLDAGKPVDYEFYLAGTADWQWQAHELPEPLPGEVVALHVGSLALVVAPGAAVLEAFVEREKQRGALTISFDPNIRPQVMPERESARQWAERLVALAHVVKVSEEDLAWLYPGADPGELAQRWRSLGPALVVVTRGEHGAVARAERCGPVEMRSPAVRVVDTVGAGDAFSAVLLHGLHVHGCLGDPSSSRINQLSEQDLAWLLERACTAASLTCAKPGADPPTLSGIEAALVARPIASPG